MSELDTLIQFLAKLPGLGPRSARRAVLHLMKRRETALQPLLSALQNVSEKLVTELASRVLHRLGSTGEQLPALTGALQKALAANSRKAGSFHGGRWWTSQSSLR